MNKLIDVKLIELKSNDAANGSLIVLEGVHDIPFNIARIFVVSCKEPSTRGKHAHIRCSQFLLCLNGSIDVLCSDGLSSKNFTLNSPNIGLLIPAGIWAEQNYHENGSILMAACDLTYEEHDYVRDFERFRELRGLINANGETP